MGLMLDKSQGLVLGPELVSNPGPGFTTSTGWTAQTDGVVTVSSGNLTLTTTATSYATIPITTVIGRSYLLSTNIVSAFSGGGFYGVRKSDDLPVNVNVVTAKSNSIGAGQCVFTATATTSYIVLQNNGAGQITVSFVTVKELPGNHALQATSASRPVLKIDGNNKFYLGFDGVNDFLGAAYVQSAYPLTLTAGINNDSIATASGAFVSVAQSDSVYKVTRDNSVGTTDAQNRNATTITVAAIAQAGNKFVLSQFETSLITHQVNSLTATTIANTNAFGTSANIFLGKARPTNLFSSAQVYSIVITNSVLSAAQITSLRSWMGEKMGVTL